MTGPRPLVPAPYTDARVRYRHGDKSEKTGRYAGEDVHWHIPAGHDVYDPGEGYGVVLVPNDGGFVWLRSEGSDPIVPAAFTHPIGGCDRCSLNGGSMGGSDVPTD